MSTDTAERTAGLFDALLDFQEDVPTLPKDKTATVRSEKGSYQYHYSSLDTIVETVQPLLTKHGLAWSSMPVSTENGPQLAYRLTHVVSGQSIDGVMPLLGASNMQQLGSAITYARRYALVAVLNLVADEDDDGQAASDLGQQYADQVAGQGDTVNLQQEAKGLRNEAINAAFARVGLPAQEKPWGQLGRVPEHQADALRDALNHARTLA